MEWTGARYADKPTVEVRIWIDATPARVWELVSDIGLMPAMSTELQSVEWLDGATGPAAGARFAGRSRHEAMGEWEAVSYVVEFEPERVFAWAIEDPASQPRCGVSGWSPRTAGLSCLNGCSWGRAGRACRSPSTGCQTRRRRSCSCGCASSSAT